MIVFLIYVRNDFEYVNTIRAYQKDIELQLDFLKSFKKQKALPNALKKNVIFSGSGDSLVSSMLAEVFSDGAVRAFDPLDLYRNKSLAKSNHVFFVSISGNTITNVKVARIAKRSTAITAKSQSRLAKASDEMILLSAPSSNNNNNDDDVFTAGSISFLESALTCISLVKNFKMPDCEHIFRSARTAAKKAKPSRRTYVLGNMLTFPLAMYCAAKFYEVMGYDAHYCRIEQFSHMELFSATKGDSVIIFEEKNSHNIQLARNLKKIGMNVIHPDVPTGKISQMLYCTFFSQFVSLFEAQRKSKRDCYFVTAKTIRNASNDMIY